MHSHFTRDIKSPGKCPACDAYWARQDEFWQDGVWVACENPWLNPYLDDNGMQFCGHCGKGWPHSKGQDNGS